jgi:transcriptional regulator with XRE-family HTH domain
MMPPKSSFGAYVQEHRLRHNWSQRELAQRVPMDFTYVYKIEAGKMNPPSERIIAQLATVLEVPVDELLLLSRKVPRKLRRLMLEQPLLSELVYTLSKKALSEGAYLELLGVIQTYE